MRTSLERAANCHRVQHLVPMKALLASIEDFVDVAVGSWVAYKNRRSADSATATLAGLSLAHLREPVAGTLPARALLRPSRGLRGAVGLHRNPCRRTRAGTLNRRWRHRP